MPAAKKKKGAKPARTKKAAYKIHRDAVTQYKKQQARTAEFHAAVDRVLTEVGARQPA